MGNPLSPDLLRKMDAYWRAANYLSVGQIYLFDNPLLMEPLKIEHIKPRLLGHWGTTPGLNFIYVHLNRVIKDRDLNVIYITGPGHGGPGLVANAYLEGTYTEVYPSIGQDEEGLKRLFTQFSFPGGIPSHVTPETPGSIHEGGELGYALSHAYGAAFDNPDLIVVAVVVAGKQLAPQWLTMDEAVKHCTAGIGIWEWASNDKGSDPDVVMACCGDVPALETLAAVELLRRHMPELKIRVVNVVDLMKLQPASEHPHGLVGPRVRHAVHQGQAGHLRLPRLPLADPPADLPPHQPRQPAHARLQGRGDDDVRHGSAQRPGPLPPGGRRHRPAASGGGAGGVPQADRPRQADRPQALHPQVRRRPAGAARLEVGRGRDRRRHQDPRHRRRQPLIRGDGRLACRRVAAVEESA
jgi:hypothetical protein